VNPEKYSDINVRTKIAERIQKVDSIDVYVAFNEQLKKNIVRIKTLYDFRLNNTAKVISDDARLITKGLFDKELLPDESVDFILTSPPYAGAQKYIRSSSLNLGWLDYCQNNGLRFYEKLNIGREHYNKYEYETCIALGIDVIDNSLKSIRDISPLRAHINGNYLLEMESAIKEMYRVLKSNCYAVIVIGNNVVCGSVFETHRYLTAIAERIGFGLELVLIDDIHSRGLMTKRNKTANIINSEWILIFKK
jgi:DNA modification methylase